MLVHHVARWAGRSSSSSKIGQRTALPSRGIYGLIYRRLHLNLHRSILNNSDTPVAVAVSGGADSIALLHLCLQHLGPHRVAACIVDHRLRNESQREADEVAAYLRGLGVSQVCLRHLNSIGQTGAKGNIQQRARQARYETLARMCFDIGATVLLTAHHMDDQIETLCMRLVRGGSGVLGYAGIPYRTAVRASTHLGYVDVVRPLLSCTKAQVYRYCLEHGLSWVEDPSNTSDKYERSRWRKLLTAMRNTANIDTDGDPWHILSRYTSCHDHDTMRLDGSASTARLSSTNDAMGQPQASSATSHQLLKVHTAVAIKALHPRLALSHDNELHTVAARLNIRHGFGFHTLQSLSVWARDHAAALEQLARSFIDVHVSFDAALGTAAVPSQALQQLNSQDRHVLSIVVEHLVRICSGVTRPVRKDHLESLLGVILARQPSHIDTTGQPPIAKGLHCIAGCVVAFEHVQTANQEQAVIFSRQPPAKRHLAQWRSQLCSWWDGRYFICRQDTTWTTLPQSCTSSHLIVRPLLPRDLHGRSEEDQPSPIADTPKPLLWTQPVVVEKDGDRLVAAPTLPKLDAELPLAGAFKAIWQPMQLVLLRRKSFHMDSVTTHSSEGSTFPLIGR